MRKYFLLIVALIIIFAPLQTVFAVSECFCYYGWNNDCSEEIIAEDAHESQCEVLCQTVYGSSYKKFDFSEDDSGIVEGLCAGAATSALVTGTVGEPLPNPVLPSLSVAIPGVSFSPILQKEGVLSIDFLGQYISGLYLYLLGIAVIIAIVMVMIGGLQYVIGAAKPDQVGKGKKRIGSALIGLFLLFGTTLVLTIVNPQLIKLKPVQVEFVEEFPFEINFDQADTDGAPDYYSAADAQSGLFFDGGAVCEGRGCIEWCTQNPGPDNPTWPLSNKKTIDPALTTKIPKSPGVRLARSVYATKEVQAALKRAGEIAVAKNPNYYILVTDGYRPLRRQIEYVCERVASGDKSKIDGIGVMVANPGDSNHGAGIALDVQFFEGSKKLVTSGSGTEQKKEQWREGAGILAEIMAEAGFVRYAKEIWHFDLESKLPKDKDCRCKGSACPFPPSC